MLALVPGITFFAPRKSPARTSPAMAPWKRKRFQNAHLAWDCFIALMNCARGRFCRVESRLRARKSPPESARPPVSSAHRFQAQPT